LQYSGLSALTQYYVRGVASNGDKQFYGRVSSFSTFDYSVPSVETDTPVEIDYRSAKLQGRIISNNAQPLQAYGFWLNEGELTEIDTFSAVHIPLGTEDVTGSVSVTIYDLKINQTYTYVLYARNSKGLMIGNTITFSVAEYPMPLIETGQVSDLSSSTCSFIHNRITDHGAEILSREIQISQFNPPEGPGSNIYTGIVDPEQDNMYYITNVSVQPGLTFYYRARAETPAGYVYGQIKAFSTPPQ